MFQLRHLQSSCHAGRERLKERINKLENGKHSTYDLNDTAQLAECACPFAEKVVMPKKDKNLMDCSRLPL